MFKDLERDELENLAEQLMSALAVTSGKPIGYIQATYLTKGFSDEQPSLF